MAVTIAVSGKGGTGKTSLICLILRQLIADGLKPSLVVDADPNSTTGDNLHVQAEQTIGDIREEALDNKDSGPAGIPKNRRLEYAIEECLVESKGFDLLVMGRQEGPGCYCYINNLLREYMDRLPASYKYILIDNEAGMEHLSRRTTNNVDYLLIVSEPSQISLNSVERINKLTKSLKLKVNKTGLILNKLPDGVPPVIEQRINEIQIPLVGTIPTDPSIVDYALAGKSLLELPDDSIAVKSVNALLHKLNIKQQN